MPKRSIFWRRALSGSLTPLHYQLSASVRRWIRLCNERNEARLATEEYEMGTR
jgi:hypothetical protein